MKVTTGTEATLRVRRVSTAPYALNLSRQVWYPTLESRASIASQLYCDVVQSSLGRIGGGLNHTTGVPASYNS